MVTCDAEPINEFLVVLKDDCIEGASVIRAAFLGEPMVFGRADAGEYARVDIVDRRSRRCAHVPMTTRCRAKIGTGLSGTR